MAVSVLLELLGDLGNFWVLDGCFICLVVLLSSGSVLSGPLLFELGASVGVLPADLGGDFTQNAELGGWLEAEFSHGFWDDDVASLEVFWDTRVGLEVGHGQLAASSLVGAHTTDGLADDVGWVTEVEWTTLVVEVGTLLEVLKIVSLGTEE